MGALTNHRAHKEARAFAAKVQRGQTYYSIERVRIACGPTELLQEWVFSGRSPVNGQPMCGHLDAEGVWLGFGPLYDSRPPKLMTHREWRQVEVAGPIAVKALPADVQREAAKAVRR